MTVYKDVLSEISNRIPELARKSHSAGNAFNVYITIYAQVMYLDFNITFNTV